MEGMNLLDRKIQEFRAQYGRNPNVPMPPSPGRIHKVTDLRTGLVHPTRDSNGRFISRRRAMDEIAIADSHLSRTIRQERGYTTPRRIVNQGDTLVMLFIESGTTHRWM